MSDYKRVRIGELNKHIQFLMIDPENPLIETDSGMNTRNYIPAFRRWCKVKDVVNLYGLDESMENDAIRSRKKVRLYCRYTEKITHDMQFIYKGETYEISLLGDKHGDGWELQIMGVVFANG
ncbi:MAG: phage head closure protein [Streptococcaceae bacterium]|jgi:SPP1 family predicted phage head-tail adaptor|nr:phage head closure protein [Streptococcaceae bacterium]